MAEQAAKLQATYDKVVWIIEADLYDGHIALEPKVITGAISHLAVVERATLLQTRSLQETADLLLSMDQRLQHGRRDLALRPSEPADPRLLAEYIVSELPKIGCTKASTLLQRFGSVRGVFTADVTDIARSAGLARRPLRLSAPRSTHPIRTLCDRVSPHWLTTGKPIPDNPQLRGLSTNQKAIPKYRAAAPMLMRFPGAAVVFTLSRKADAQGCDANR
jgi:hypothetical protein